MTMYNPERVYLQKAIEEAEIEEAYNWFYDAYTPEEQEELLESFENNPIQFVKEARWAI